MPVMTFNDAPFLSFTDHNYKFSAISKDLKYIALARSFPRKDSEIMDIVLVKIKNLKETILLDTQTMIRYGRPNGFLYSLSFNEQGLLIAKIEDGMEGTSILAFDPEKEEIVKDEYLDDYWEEETEIIDKINFEQKMKDLKRLFPSKNNILLMDLAYRLMAVDTAGYLTQGILANDNSIFYLSHKDGKLRLIHNMSDVTQSDNINGLWGTKDHAFYFLKDKKHDYFFKYDIKMNVVTLLEIFPAHSHYTYINSINFNNGDILLSFEVENNMAGEQLKLFRYSRGILYKIDDYPALMKVNYLSDHNLLLLYYLKEGKQCLDVRNLN